MGSGEGGVGWSMRGFRDLVFAGKIWVWVLVVDPSDAFWLKLPGVLCANVDLVG